MQDGVLLVRVRSGMGVEAVRIKLAEIDKLVKKYNDRLLHPAFFAALNRKFEGKYSKVAQMLQDRAVKKYVFKPSGRIRWIVQGDEGDHLIYPEAPYCSCRNFYMHVVDGLADVCSHLIAQRIAQLKNLYDTIEESDENYKHLNVEWKNE